MSEPTGTPTPATAVPPPPGIHLITLTGITTGEWIADPRRDGTPAQVIGFGRVDLPSRSMCLTLRDASGTMRAAYYGLDEQFQIIAAVV